MVETNYFWPFQGKKSAYKYNFISIPTLLSYSQEFFRPGICFNNKFWICKWIGTVRLIFMRSNELTVYIETGLGVIYRFWCLALKQSRTLESENNWYTISIYMPCWFSDCVFNFFEYLLYSIIPIHNWFKPNSSASLFSI